MRIDYTLADVAPYINWVYFFHAWGMSGKPQAEKDRLRQEAERRLQRHATDYHTHAVFQLFDAVSDGDDIVIEGRKDEAGKTVNNDIVTQPEDGNRQDDVTGVRIPLLRQQEADSDFLCLADFIAAKDKRDATVTSSITSGSLHDTTLGVFATTVDMGLETDFAADPYEHMMMQLLADRLAEATAEVMHQDVRRRFWGYAPGEALTVGQLHQEQFQGIRPAVGYPSLPDTSLNFLIDRLIGMGQIGIRLTESGAMKPHASVSGLMMAHPAAHYFAVGKIGEDQLRDYAGRRGLPVETTRKFLAVNL